MQRGEKDAKRSSVVRSSGSGTCPSCPEPEECFWVLTTWQEEIVDERPRAVERDECSLGYWWCAEGHSAFVRERGPSGRTGEWIRKLVQATQVRPSWHLDSDDEDSESSG